MKYFRGLPPGNPLLLFIIPIKAKYAGLHVPAHSTFITFTVISKILLMIPLEIYK